MAIYAEICEAVEKLKKKYDETDPFRLCRCMGILLLFYPLGSAPDAVKGFFVEADRNRAITVNSDLPLFMQKIIVLHELGHAELHRSSGIFAFHDFLMYDSVSEYEKEANLFAAEYLLNDEDVLDALRRNETFFAAASELMVPPELLDFKYRLLKSKGYPMPESPMTARSNFLRDLEIPENSDYYVC